MLDSVRPLWDMGFAVHWLRPKSKIPVKSGWTKGERVSWRELRESYRPGFNVGVRLGRASRLADGYLGVIDCDVKDVGARAEMEKALLGLGLDPSCPVVLTGRGGGSKHIYVRSPEPLESRRFAGAKGRVKTLMPSSEASGQDKQLLSAEELAQGYRMRQAWEISIMGEGRQVVLPPSIHPDSGKAYRWDGDGLALGVPEFVAPRAATIERAFLDNDTGGTFVPVSVKLDRLPAKTRALIVSGDGCFDRSAGLFSATMMMVKAGYKDAEILSVLTDRANFLGEAAYDHAKTGERGRAVAWVRRYTLVKAKAEVSVQNQFEATVVREPAMSEGAAKGQEKEVLGLTGWKADIDRVSEAGRPRLSVQNVILILGNEFPRLFKFNQFDGTTRYGAVPPWGGREDAEITDHDLIHMKVWLADHYRFEPPTQVIVEAVTKLALRFSYHPVRSFVLGLEWDGVARLDGWLADYMGATGEQEYLAAVGRKTLVALVARVFEPGCKFDQVLIMEGIQGCGKSTALRILSQPWFSDAQIDIGEKDGVLALRSAWIVELGELSGMRKTDADQLKEFISRQADRIRAPYDRLSKDFPRQCIFVGTTNSNEYLKDETGNRRFWPVAVERCKFDLLKRDRDQLIAEAFVTYQLGEALYLEHQALRDVASAMQEARLHRDEWIDQIAIFLHKKNPDVDINYDAFSVSDIIRCIHTRDGRTEQMRVAAALKKLNYKKFRALKGGVRITLWSRHTKGMDNLGAVW